ncbi:hypothetical protein [Sphingobium subterraneum]|uniref:Lipoprotein n=1 Tax=Sphingobium subterraneum TaxID=627688 RepID=A0A841IVE1_9SPHN|nr:hypothetical protein [Sphingobium subterraneum]MBB6122304.1 hypothetical protein [Sphingobium subterraneum]
MKHRTIALMTISLLLPGCLVRAAADVATAPVRAGSQVADWATVSQDEADRNRGRDMRKAEKEQRKRDREACRDAGYRNCD